MSVGRICTRQVDIATPEETAQAAAQRMHARKVGSLVVLDKAQVPVGLITDRDLSVRVLAEGRDSVETPLAEVMTRAPKTIHEDAPIEEALRIMRCGAFRRLPVVDRSGKLAGLITLDDILELLTEEFRDLGGMLAQETPRNLARA